LKERILLNLINPGAKLFFTDFPILEILFDFIFLVIEMSFIPARGCPTQCPESSIPTCALTSVRPNMAKPTINTEHAFLINTSWHEKE